MWFFKLVLSVSLIHYININYTLILLLTDMKNITSTIFIVNKKYGNFNFQF